MKLLLTSNGLANQSIAEALFDLVGKPASETAIAFIPTAMNMTSGDKGWFVNDLHNMYKQGLKKFDIVEIADLPKEIFMPRLEAADVLFLSGGHTYHLMNRLRESGLDKELPKLLQTRIYAGISAGSIATSSTLALSSQDKKMYYEEAFGYSDEAGLELVNFYVRPHLNSPDFPHAKKEVIESIAEEEGITIYGIDDQSALKVVDGAVEVISEGEYIKLN